MQFAATLNGAAMSCTKDITGLGPTKQNTVGVSDLRLIRES